MRDYDVGSVELKIVNRPKIYLEGFGNRSFRQRQEQSYGGAGHEAATLGHFWDREDARYGHPLTLRLDCESPQLNTGVGRKMHRQSLARGALSPAEVFL